MKRATCIGLICIVLVATVVAVFISVRKPQLEHKHKSLNDWMVELFSTYPRRNLEAIEALRAMGQPAVLELSEMVEREDSALTKKLLKHSDKLPVIGEVIPSKYWYRYMAAMTLGEIGTNAASAIPALRTMSADADQNLGRVATAALVLVQNEPIDKYIKASLDYGNTNSTKAYGILLSLGPHAKEGVPAYFKELETTNSRIRLRSLNVLQHICAESPECLPVFTNLLTDPDALTRSLAIDGLGNCGPLAKSVAPTVAAMLEDPDAGCRSSALIFFMRVIPPSEFRPFSSLVQRATNDVDQLVRDLAIKLLDEKMNKN